MGLPMRKNDRLYAYGDYKTWPDEEQWELIHGVAWNMSPGPNRNHQRISMNLIRVILPYVDRKKCEMYHAPLDVLLPQQGEKEEDEVTNVVQPDISIICDERKLTVKGCIGAPDWVIEILSPFTSYKDQSAKLHLYEEHGVREYWVVDPGNEYVHVYILGKDGAYPEDPAIYLREERIACTVLDGLILELSEIFR